MVGATRVPVDCPAASEALLKKAAAARAVESTAMNAVSSRSHSVFTLYIRGKHQASGQSLEGALNLVDLAGRLASIWCCVLHAHIFLCATRIQTWLAFARAHSNVVPVKQALHFGPQSGLAEVPDQG